MGRHSATPVPGATPSERAAVVRRPAVSPPVRRRAAQAPLRSARVVEASRPSARRQPILPLLGFCASFAFVAASLVNPLAGAQATTATTGGAAALVAPGQSFSVDAAVQATAASRDAYEITQYVPPAPVVTEEPEADEAEATAGATAAPEKKKSSAAPAAGTPDPGSAKAIAADIVASKGWGTGEYDCLVALWQKESSWNVYAYNPSGAYGIPQALPGSKMASAGADWQTNPATQITWGLGYIQGRYGTPCGAWAHSKANNWY